MNQLSVPYPLKSLGLVDVGDVLGLQTPTGALGPVLALPDRHGGFEGVDPEASCLEGVIPMGRQSSAYGFSQALDGTWDEYRDATGNRGARRDNIRDATDFMGWYMNESQRRNGIPLSDARRQYLAYHEGHTGYARGTYNRKSWLLRVSSEVAQRARTYESQLATCRV